MGAEFGSSRTLKNRWMGILGLGMALIFTGATGDPKALSATSALQKIDLLVENAQILTQDPALPIVDALAVHDGRVLAIGTPSELLRKFRPTQILNYKGAVILPGFADAHGHVSLLAEQSLKAQLSGADSVAEVLKRVKDFAGGALPPQAWILGEGWDQNRWKDKKFPTRQDLDAVFPDHPVWLDRVDGHAAWGNSLALKLANVTRNTVDPAGGKIIRDSNGDPTGVFVDNAMDLVSASIPPFSEAQLESGLREAIQALLSAGITTVHDAGTTLKAWNRYLRFAQAGEMGIRIYGFHSGAGPEFDSLCASGPQVGLFDGKLSLRGVKLFADGALGSRGAALLKDYTDDPGNQGLLLQTVDQLNQSVERVMRCGFQVAVHAIGDRANRVTLDAIERAEKRIGKSDRRPRIEHAQVVSPPDFARFGSLGVIASIQPTHATSDMPWAEARLGPDRILGAYAWRTFLNSGVRIAAGSDFPVERINPFEGFYAALSRKDLLGAPNGGWYPAQRLTREEALRAFTTDAAYAAFQENEIGVLSPGKRADFIVVDRNPFDTSERETAMIQVLETFVGGKSMFVQRAWRDTHP